MQKDISYVDLLKEEVDLIRDYRPFFRGVFSKQLSLVIQRALIKNMPKTLTDYNLQPFESIFLSAMLVESDVCRDIIKCFSRFWAGSYEAALKVQLEIELSLHHGGLKNFIEDEGVSRIRVKPDLRIKLLTALVSAEVTGGGGVL